MASIQFSIDFGEPDGTLEEMGCEGLTSAAEVLAALKNEGRSVREALEAWDLLQFGTVSVTFIPDIPPELMVQSMWVLPDKPPPWTKELAAKHAALREWVAANQTTAEWSDFGG